MRYTFRMVATATMEYIDSPDTMRLEEAIEEAKSKAESSVMEFGEYLEHPHIDRIELYLPVTPRIDENDDVLIIFPTVPATVESPAKVAAWGKRTTSSASWGEVACNYQQTIEGTQPLGDDVKHGNQLEEQLDAICEEWVADEVNEIEFVQYERRTPKHQERFHEILQQLRSSKS